jgi:hypothetical protein
MSTLKTAALPSGGPLKVDVRVAELLLAQLAIMCAPRSDQHEKDAISRRKVILQSLDAAQRAHARTVCSILLRLLDERPTRKHAAQHKGERDAGSVSADAPRTEQALTNNDQRGRGSNRVRAIVRATERQSV